MAAYASALAEGFWRRPRRRSGSPGAAAARPDPALGARPRRREHPGADPGQRDDGALQQARLAGADHRQQERDVGRLRDPLRRHGGGLRGDQGRAEDARLRAGAPPQRAGRPRAGPRLGAGAGALGGAAARPARQRLLPPYELLDRMLEAYVERDEGREEMVAAGMPAEVVDEVVRMVDRSEYKRRQAAPGIRITPKAFGRDRRLPITNRFGGRSDRRLHGSPRRGGRCATPRPEPRDRDSVEAPGSGRTAMVIWASAQRRSSASRTSASQTQVVRPRWRAWP